jgi:hypothetical protein
MRSAAILIMLIGVVLTLYTGLSYVTKDKVVDIGTIEITKDTQHSVSWPIYTGVAALFLGGILYVTSRKKTMAI